MSRYATLELNPLYEVTALNHQCAADPCPNKVNLCVGGYRTNEGQPWVMPVVREVEKTLAADDKLNKEYLPVLGLEAFYTAANEMLLGKNNPAVKENRAFGIQTLSGTGGIRLGAEFLTQILNYKTFYSSAETWDSHRLIFPHAGFTKHKRYRYWCQATRGLDLDGLLEDLNKARENSVVILQACAHNPTGCDPTQEQWRKIADVMEKRKLFPFFDLVYQGFATGDLEQDAWSVRYFASRGFELLCAQSFAKNFAIYSERIGNLTFVVKNTEVIPRVKSQITLLIRGMYSNPPSHGARIVAHILNTPMLYARWKQELQTISSRNIAMRKALRQELENLNTPGDWGHITSQIGMFSFTGLNENQSLHMMEKHHVYMLRSGRISVCGLTFSNVKYVAKAISETVLNIK